MTSHPPLAPRLLTQAHVGHWLRIKADQPPDTADFGALLNVGYATYPHDPRSDADRLRSLLRQLASDADHSDLLWRMARGEEPRP